MPTRSNRLIVVAGLSIATGAITLLSAISAVTLARTIALSVYALVWLSVGIGLLRESALAVFVARVLIAASIALSLLPLLAFVLSPRDPVHVSLPLLPRFDVLGAYLVPLLAGLVVLEYWQLRVLNTFEMDTRVAPGRAKRAVG
jgi:hypothetical protein